MNENIKQAILGGRVVLLLGAGASRTSRDRRGSLLLDGWGLAKMLAQEAGMPFADEPLPVVYAATKQALGGRLNQVFEQNFKHARPSIEYEVLSRYPWARIYTLNIDDAFEKALRRNSPQDVNVRNRFDKISDRAPFYDEVDYVKLNGSVDRLQDGFVFSPQEYGAASAQPPLWYEELARDFFRYTFIFIGTKLAEPLFYHQVERYRQTSGSSEGVSYVITPAASPIEVFGLKELNLTHISGTLKDFSDWLQREVSPPPSVLDVAEKYHPQISFLANMSQRRRHLDLFESVVRVSHADLASELRGQKSPHRVRDFYRGFKPTWEEVLAGVPARLRAVRDTVNYVKKAGSSEKLFVIFGPAGSGKTTALMQAALELSVGSSRPIYLLSEAIKNTRELMYALEESSKGPYVLFIDKLAAIADSVLEVLKSNKFINGIVVATERQNIWSGRTRSMFEQYVAATIPVELIDKKEANEILLKLEQYGPWHRLSKMSGAARIEELLKKSQRQLLIGLLEATQGHGFDKIIGKDYSDLRELSAKLFVVLVGFGTIHQEKMPEAIASRALKHLGIIDGVPKLLELTSGIVRRSGNSLVARHPVYIERLFELSVEKDEKVKVIHALLHAFAAYERPLMRSVGKGAGRIFKLTVNHNFLKNTLHGDKELVLDVYESFAKAFQDDGLFWLQFGLALRDANLNDSALEKLRVAHSTHSLRHADHAYAQQLLIVARKDASKTVAYAYLQEAIEILEKLDVEVADLDESEPDYPIVTLSEGHTSIAVKFEGWESGREIAKHYSNVLSQRRKENPHNQRLKQAWKSITNFATGGKWEPSALGGR